MLLPILPCLLGTALQAAGASNTDPTIDLGYAKYQGSYSSATNTTEFLGIRFAAPPLGDLRFAAPQPPLKENSTVNATKFAPRCLQSGLGAATSNPYPRRDDTDEPEFPADSEDCLYLNVYTPGQLAASPSTKLPVIIWIHGGGYVLGGASGTFTPGDSMIQNGTDLVRESGNTVITVVIQYRLGLFGFLAGEEVKKNGSLNAGLLDQEFALKWVQQHIAKFGGDPNLVTIWGVSAGAGSVFQHVIAHNGQTQPPLFRAGITNSLFLPSQYKYNDPVPESIYSKALNLTGCSTSQGLACLRQASVDVLEAVNNEINTNGFFGTFVTVPVVDGTFITDRPRELIKAGKLNGQALLSVDVAEEGPMFTNPNTTSNDTLETYFHNLFPFLTPSQIQTGVKLYDAVNGSRFNQTATIYGESIFVCPTYSLLDGWRKTKNDVAYKSEFAIPPALHGSDFPYYFLSQNPNGIPPYPNPDFSKAFYSTFLDFARFLDPNHKSQNTITPHWTAWSESSPSEMLFNKTETTDAPIVKLIKTDPKVLERCAFWEEVGKQTGQ